MEPIRDIQERAREKQLSTLNKVKRLVQLN
ncbi:hypothetical protein ACUXPN_001438 [Staphylococcus epidermidis]